MYTKGEIFNIALNALLLERQIVDPDNDQSTEARRLRMMWNPAFTKALQDMDLDRTSEIKTLELITEQPNDLWAYAYKYPNNCAFVRRIVTLMQQDNSSTRIPLRTAVMNGESVIFTNEPNASIEYIPRDISPAHLNASAGFAVGYNLASMSASLIVGKGAQKIRQEILEMYRFYKAEAQEVDRMENMNYEADRDVSEFVRERTS